MYGKHPKKKPVRLEAKRNGFKPTIFEYDHFGLHLVVRQGADGVPVKLENSQWV